jgi:hypothetical protein
MSLKYVRFYIFGLSKNTLQTENIYNDNTKHNTLDVKINLIFIQQIMSSKQNTYNYMEVNNNIQHIKFCTCVEKLQLH